MNTISTRKNCLLILPRPIFPLVCGYALKNYNLIKILSSNYNLNVVLISEEIVSLEEQKFYDDLSVKVTLYKIPKYRSYLNCIKGLFSSRPLQVCYFYDKFLQVKINQLVEQNDILIAALIRTREYFNNVSLAKNKVLIFDMVDSIALNYLHSKDHTSSMFWKILYSIESARLMGYEQKYIQHSTATYLFNPDEVKFWSSAGNVCWLPHGVNEQLFTYNKINPIYSNSVVFIGKMNYRPNIEAVIWYLKNVHSNIGEKIPLIIVGAYPTEEVQLYAQKLPNITITGYVEDPYIYMNSALAIIAPMQTGGGIQNKVLEGMALGKVNIITSLAAASIIEAENGKHFLIADTPEKFQKYILDVAANRSNYHNMETAARKLIMEKFTWNAYGKYYIDGIERALHNGDR